MAEPGVRRPSIRDVAAAAGVSYQTVSRVLNEPALVRPSTAERVQRVIKELGYRPSKAARSLVRRDSTTIGAVGTQNATGKPWISPNTTTLPGVSINGERVTLPLR